MKIAIAGSSGFVGSWLKKSFDDVIEINRVDFKNNNFGKIKDCDILINLCGAPIIQRWNKKIKKEIYDSRIQTTKKLVQALENSNIKHFISTSAVGYYKDEELFDEYNAKNSSDFLGQLTKNWESEALKSEIPTTILRFGVVLDKSGGALKKMYLPFSLGLGGNIDDGKAWFSWIDLYDLLSIFHFVIEKKITGTLNATSPNPIKNEEFTSTFAKILKKPAFLPLPEFVLKIIFSEGAQALTSSKRVVPKKLMESGFEFKYETINKSLNRSINGIIL